MTARALSIRMEGDLERLIALGDRFEQGARDLGSVTVESCSRVAAQAEALVREDALFTSILCSFEKLGDVAQPEDLSARGRAVVARARFEAAVREISPASPEASLADAWTAVGGRLQLRARINSASRKFMDRPITSVRAVAAMAATLLLEMCFLTVAPAKLWFVIVVALGIGLHSAFVMHLDGQIRGLKCPYCREGEVGVDWFNDVPAVRRELVRPLRDTSRSACGSCGMSRLNFDAALRLLRRTDLSLPP